MQNSQLPELKAPWVVGRETLVEHAADDFLNEVTRQTPWLRARYETLLEELTVFLDADQPAHLCTLTDAAAQGWLAQVDVNAREQAGLLASEFLAYIDTWGWRTTPLTGPSPAE